MAKTNFDDLLHRYLTNQVTEEEKRKFEAWMKMTKTDDTSDLELTDEEEELLARKIKSNAVGVREIQTFIPGSVKRERRNRWLLRAAAGLLLLAVAGYGIWGLTDSDPSKLDITGGTEKMVLNDGSLVWVREGGKLSYYEKPEGRFAELTGEAFFEVAKDPGRPFTIRYKDVNVRVVGTSFSLSTGDSVVLKVLTGKVNIASATDQAGRNIEPFQKAVYKVSEGIKMQVFAREEASAITAGTEYNMQFRNATFATVVERLENKFDVRIDLRNAEIAKCHVNLDITDHSLESSLQMIASVLNVEYEKERNFIRIAGTGCK